jgi:hypothetical protein
MSSKLTSRHDMAEKNSSNDDVKQQLSVRFFIIKLNCCNMRWFIFLTIYEFVGFFCIAFLKMFRKRFVFIISNYKNQSKLLHSPMVELERKKV